MVGGDLRFPAICLSRGLPGFSKGTISGFYLASNGENWDENTNWLSDAPLGEWYGVTTDKDGRVVSLRLPDNGLSGDIWPGLIRLRGLQHLDLSGNRLSGAIPHMLDDLSNLSVLLLNDNELTGEVPARLAIIVPNLREFDLGGNRLTGCIPEDFKKAPPGSPGRSGIDQLGLPFCAAGSQAGGARATPTPGSRATAGQTPRPRSTAVSGSTRVPSTVAPTASPVPETRAGPVSTPTSTSELRPANFRPADGHYDTDSDGLIGVFNLEQLNAIRYDLDGDGRSDDRRNPEAYDAAYPDASSCKRCIGYELARPLDFDDPGSYASGTVDPGWTPGGPRATAGCPSASAAALSKPRSKATATPSVTCISIAPALTPACSGIPTALFATLVLKMRT